MGSGEVGLFLLGGVLLGGAAVGREVCRCSFSSQCLLLGAIKRYALGFAMHFENTRVLDVVVDFKPAPCIMRFRGHSGSLWLNTLA